MSTWGHPYQATANMDRRMFDIETKEVVQQLKKAGFANHSQLARVHGISWATAKKLYCNSKTIRISGGAIKALKKAIETGNELRQMVLSFNAALEIVEGHRVN